MQNEVKNRGINYLWHFTRIENLPSILVNGLIPRAALEVQHIAIAYNDAHRYDGQREANCLSVTHPNYKMFYYLRLQNSAQLWVVLAIKPKILWEKDCAFCHDNAASNNIVSIPIGQRKGIPAFRRMFEEVEGKPSRATLKLTDDFPTNPQAEILVFGVIEPHYIIGAITQTRDIEIQLADEHPNFTFKFYPPGYHARKDYEHWK